MLHDFVNVFVSLILAVEHALVQVTNFFTIICYTIFQKLFHYIFVYIRLNVLVFVQAKQMRLRK